MFGKPFYITTTLPYVNAKPHIGFALEIVQADVIARHKLLLGFDVFFNTGTDEHGQKIYKKTLEEGIDPKAYCDKYAAKFDKLKEKLNLSYNNFIRTTDENHIRAAQEFWKRCSDNGDIYKKIYQAKYCVGCELEKTDSELVDGKCPYHPNKELELIDEENYFFKFSNYQGKLLDLYKNNLNFVVPGKRLNEIRSFVESGLNDFSISRLKSKMPWGVDVPGDSEHVMYVWFDALVNYISSLGWPNDSVKFEKYWPGIQVAGKDNLRQQAAMWQAMLMSAGVSPSNQVFIHGFINSNGQKMSKSLRNVVDPFELVFNYGTDAVRYYILSGCHPVEDSDFSIAKFEEKYNAELANGLGNLVSRVVKMSEIGISEKITYKSVITEDLSAMYDEFRFNEIIDYIYGLVREANEYMNEKSPWKLEGEEKKNVLISMMKKLQVIGELLSPIIPESSEKILRAIERPLEFKDSLFLRV